MSNLGRADKIELCEWNNVRKEYCPWSLQPAYKLWFQSDNKYSGRAVTLNGMHEFHLNKMPLKMAQRREIFNGLTDDDTEGAAKLKISVLQQKQVLSLMDILQKSFPGSVEKNLYGCI